ncbi:MAG: FAD-dependent oxidoreductase [Flavobacteriales bacterium]|jgi:kynurenine 3-monooxygenase
MAKERIAVVGGGLVGSLWSVYLSRRGFDVHVFDRRPDIRQMKIVQGKSINLALSERGWRGLDGAGIGPQVREVALPMTGRLMHGLDGSLTYQPYGKEGQAIYSVSRGLLNQTMVKLAGERDNVSLYFSHRCADISPDEKSITFIHEETGERTTHHFDRIFGTDGAFSAVRSRMQRMDRFDYSQSYLNHGYKELEIPAQPDGTHRMRKDVLHIWPRQDFMMIALPNVDGSFTCTLFLAFEGKESFEQLTTPEAVKGFFTRWFPDVIEMMPELTDDFFTNPTSSLVMVKCYPWHHRDAVCLMGDAAHAIVPFYGQGMNCGFEDCTVLDGLIDKHGDNWSEVFSEFTRIRKPAGDAVLELALRNYIEMRDKTADPRFLLQKKIEARFASRHPELWVPLYSQVTFTHIPYDQALRNGDRQEAIMQRVMSMEDIAGRWDSDDVETLMLSLVERM